MCSSFMLIWDRFSSFLLVIHVPLLLPIGHIGISDFDLVELSNIHRQILHSEQSVGQSKVESVVSELRKRCETSYVQITPIERPIDQTIPKPELISIISTYNIVCDCTDSVEARYLLGDICAELGKPLVAGDAVSWEGQCTVYNAFPESPCLRCVHPIPPEKRHIKKAKDVGVVCLPLLLIERLLSYMFSQTPIF